MQSRIESTIETLINVTTGFGVSWGVNMSMLPYFGFQVTGSQSLIITLVFTLVSVIRSYVIRRLFNRYQIRKYREMLHAKS